MRKKHMAFSLGFSCYPKDAILLCGNYDKHRRLNLQALKQKYRDNPVFAIPYCSEYGDAIAESAVRRFFLANEHLFDEGEAKRNRFGARKPEDSTEYFFKELSRLRKSFRNAKLPVKENEEDEAVKEVKDG